MTITDTYTITGRLDSWEIDLTHKLYNSLGAGASVWIKVPVHEVLPRVFHAVFGVVKVLTALIDTINGAKIALQVILGLGLNKDLYRATSCQLKSAQLLLPRLVKSIVESAYPNAFGNRDEPQGGEVKSFSKQLKDFKENEGWEKNFSKSIKGIVQKEQIEKKEHVYVRIYCIGYFIFRPFMRIPYLVTILPAVFRLIKPEENEPKEKKAERWLKICKALQVGGIPRDLFRATVKFINPWIKT